MLLVLFLDEKNQKHRGQMWVFFSPQIKATFFNYEPSRNIAAADEVLSDYSGILQTDGYSVYQNIAKRNGIKLIHCMAHARRKFFDAKENEPLLAGFFLEKIQMLYEIERKAKEQKMTPEQRLQLRQQQAIPILDEMVNG